MPVQSRDGKHRARLQVAGQRHECPWRQSLAAAESDMEALEKARDASADIAAVVAMLHETKASHAKKYEIQILGDKFRVRLKRNQHDYVGVRRTVREQAVQDAERLVAAADISIPALEAEVERLNQESGTKEEALENAVAEAMRHWLERGSTSEIRDVSRKLQTRMRRVKRGDDQDVLFAAAKMMVDEYLKMKQFAKDNPAQWLSDLDGYMSDYVSSPRGTSGLQYLFWRTDLRNLGNSCFLNAVVQCMVNCQSLRKDLCETHFWWVRCGSAWKS